MSTDWGVRCVDCDATGCWMDERGFDDVVLYIRLADALATIHEGGAADHLVVSRWPGDRNRADLAFFARHRGHQLVPHDEYGCDDGQCHDHVQIDTTEAKWANCVLDYGHDGPHVPGRRGKPPNDGVR